jgi:hypothetical protein
MLNVPALFWAPCELALRFCEHRSSSWGLASLRLSFFWTFAATFGRSLDRAELGHVRWRAPASMCSQNLRTEEEYTPLSTRWITSACYARIGMLSTVPAAPCRNLHVRKSLCKIITI